MVKIPSHFPCAATLTRVVLAFTCLALIVIFWPDWTEKSEEISPAIVATKARSRVPSKDAPFWNSAVVAESDVFREPSAVMISQSKFSPVDHATEVARFFKTGEMKELNFALAAWFDADAVAARDWLAEQESLDSYQSALTMIVGKIATAGDPAHALEWAALLKPGLEHEQAVFDAYVVAARGRFFTRSELAAAPLPADRVAELLGGAAGD